MKKVLLAVITIAVLGITSCKKEETAQPEFNQAEKVLDKKDSATWD